MQKTRFFTPGPIPRALASISMGLSALAVGCVDSGEPEDPTVAHFEQRSEVDHAVDVAQLALEHVDALVQASPPSSGVAVARDRLRLAAASLKTAGQDLRQASSDLVPDRGGVLGQLSIRGGQIAPSLRALARAIRGAGLDSRTEKEILSAIAGARLAVGSLDLAVRDLFGAISASEHGGDAGDSSVMARTLGATRSGPLFFGSGLYALDEGHIDAIDIAYDNGFELSIHDETVDPDVERDPATTILVVKAAARVQVPDDRFSFLGPVGANVWILPEAQPDAEAAGILWPGISTEEVAAGLFVNDTVRVRVRNVFGPNGLALFFSPSDETTPPTLLVDSENGLPDHINLPVGTHTHVNWAFESPGIYWVKYDVTGRLAALPGYPSVRSSTTTLKFVVIP